MISFLCKVNSRKGYIQYQETTSKYRYRTPHCVFRSDKLVLFQVSFTVCSYFHVIALVRSL